MDCPTTFPSALGSGLSAENLTEQSRRVRAFLMAEGLHAGDTWRVSPTPFLLRDADLSTFELLGRHLLALTKSVNRLYHGSVHGRQPTWVSEYLDQGKPEELIAYARMKRFRDDVPGVIRPDLILTEDGFIISELDSVPGGIGMTACMARAYADMGWSLAGGRDGMVAAFARMIRDLLPEDQPSLGIVVSEEAKDYRAEMTWLAARLREAGLPAETVSPQDVTFTEEGLWLTSSAPIEVLYRFFELFDLKNIPKAELLLYAAKKGRVRLTPPVKPWLEEKMIFALLHHPALEAFWIGDLGSECFQQLRRWIPRTWILDPRPVPPYAVIPGLNPGGAVVSHWGELAGLGQKQRRYVIKPSGFSELAWGSRGVAVGHDLPQGEWAETLNAALASYEQVPYVLQEFHKGRRVLAQYLDLVTDSVMEMPGRVRLSPYYFVSGDAAELGGILATVCPLDKKVIHGMRDAVMAPCAFNDATGAVSIMPGAALAQ